MPARSLDFAKGATPAWSVRYLVGRNVLSAADVLESGAEVDEVSMSHRAFRVRVGGRARFFVKCADPIGSHGRNLSLEAAIYRMAATSESLRQVLPACHYIDEPGGVVVLEDAGRDTLASYLLPAGAPDGQTASILAAYGAAMARVHVVRPPPLGEKPWLLSALEPVWRNYDWLPRPCAEVLARLASSPSIRDGFRRARSRWKAYALVHGDLRWANVLVDADEEHSRVLLVDWELACLGDPSWDLGSALADLVMLLALSGGRVDDQEFAAWAAPLLAGYARSLREPAGWPALVELAVSMAGIRLVQGLIEIGHVDPNQMAAAEPVLVASISKLLAQGGNIAIALVDAAERSR